MNFCKTLSKFSNVAKNPQLPSLLRSLLYLPGLKEKMIIKAASSQADGIVICLEDAVAPDQKSAAREMTLKVLSSLSPRPSSQTISIRVKNIFRRCYLWIV